MLKCSDDSYYVGVTNNLERRLWEHQEGVNKTAYTYKRRPVEMIFSESFEDPQQAINFEKQIKGWRREKKEALINGQWEKLPELSKRYQSSSRTSE